MFNRCRARKLSASLASAAALALLTSAAAYAAPDAAVAVHPTAPRAALAITPSATGHDSCAAVRAAGQAQCMAEVGTAASAPKGLSPAQLRSAYNLNKAAQHDGSGETVAIVSAYGDPEAAADLATYRAHFKLGTCSLGSKCLRIVNEHGGSSALPANDPTWANGDSIALDAVSALCPRCHLLLVEAASNSLTDLGTAEDTAVTLGARFIVNGWDGPESADEFNYARYFNHLGVAIVFASSNSGYGPTFPGDLPYVTSVGGTTLTATRFNTRHWAETTWADTGSGCSYLEVKPSWQRADANPTTGCMNRTQNDVAADANPSTGAAVYDSDATTAGWQQAGGTVLAAAIVTAAYALAGTPARDTYPASYPYQHTKDLYDVTSGANGGCTLARVYLCTAQRGYDGPTGLGTPDGDRAFAAAGTDPVTVLDPGTEDEEAGTAISVHITGLDSVKGDTLRYSATGLPPGLSVKSVPRSTDAEIVGKVPATARTYTVTVTATDTKARKAGSARFWLVAGASLTPVTPVTTAIATEPYYPDDQGEQECLDAGAGTAGTDVTIQSCSTGAAEQTWTYLPEGAPGAPDRITIDGQCLGLNSGTLQLATCNRSLATQGWRILSGATLQNAGTGTCVQTGASYTNPLTMHPCNATLGYQQWYLQVATLQSAVPGMCLAEGGAVPSVTFVVQPCGSGSGQHFFIQQNGVVMDPGGDFCMVPGNGGVIGLEGLDCNGSNPDQIWLSEPNGELANEATGMCLDDPKNSTAAGTQLQIAPCYGTLGEIWAVA